MCLAGFQIAMARWWLCTFCFLSCFLMEASTEVIFSLSHPARAREAMPLLPSKCGICFSKPLTLGCPSDLLWPTAWVEVTLCEFLSLGFKMPCSFHLCFLRIQPPCGRAWAKPLNDESPHGERESQPGSSPSSPPHLMSQACGWHPLGLSCT